MPNRASCRRMGRRTAPAHRRPAASTQGRHACRRSRMLPTAVDRSANRLPRRGTRCCACTRPLATGPRMSTESQLRDKIAQDQALCAGAVTSGERLAAAAALERVRARLTELRRQDPPAEPPISLSAQWSPRLSHNVRNSLVPLVVEPGFWRGAEPPWRGWYTD